MKNQKLIDQYCIDNSTPESDLLNHVHRQTQLKSIMADMSSGHLQGRLLSFISQLMKPKRILELGTFTAYATLCLAEGLDSNGQLDTIEVKAEREFLIKAHIEKSDYKDQIKVHYGAALDILKKLDGLYDLIFIDAAKHEYQEYYDIVFEKWQKGGVMIVDNVLWYGNVLDPKNDITSRKINAFNQFVKDDPRVENFILPFRDGLNIIRKKEMQIYLQQ